MPAPPFGPGQNKPESGTYGEVAELDQLQSDLSMGPAGPGPAGPSPMPEPNPMMPGAPGGRPVDGPPGVPPALMGEGDPAMPTESPMAGGGPMSSPEAARLSLLEQLSTSPEVSESTRQWAQMVLEAIYGA